MIENNPTNIQAAFEMLLEEIEARVQAATARVEKITQAILAKAFRGELVPTEAEVARQEGRGCEPASVLLERIRTARDESNVIPRRQRRRREWDNLYSVRGEI